MIPFVRAENSHLSVLGCCVACAAFSSPIGSMQSGKHGEGPLLLSPLWCHWDFIVHMDRSKMIFSWHPSAQPVWLLELWTWLLIPQNMGTRPRQLCPIPTCLFLWRIENSCHSVSPTLQISENIASLLCSYIDFGSIHLFFESIHLFHSPTLSLFYIMKCVQLPT